MELSKLLENRYSTKAFDGSKTLGLDEIKAIKELLRLSPSSTNLQPWYFVIGTSPEARQKFIDATAGQWSFNTDKVTNASAIVLFCAKVDIEEDYLKKVTDKEEKDGRYGQAVQKKSSHDARTWFSEWHKYTLKDLEAWNDRQVYLNIGHFTLGCAALGLDTLVMEGLDFDKLAKDFDLLSDGYRPVCAVAIGYRLDSDFNAKLPKSRLDESDVIKVY